MEKSIEKNFKSCSNSNIIVIAIKIMSPASSKQNKILSSKNVCMLQSHIHLLEIQLMTSKNISSFLGGFYEYQKTKTYIDFNMHLAFQYASCIIKTDNIIVWKNLNQ